MPVININGINIYYTQAGQGQDLVCLLGWGQSTPMFEPSLKHYESNFRVTLFDFPGFGQSEAMREAWDMDAYVAFFSQLCEALSIKKPILIAHSFGARVAALYASQYPTRKLILTGAAGLRSKPSATQSFRSLLFRSLRSTLRLLKLSRVEEALKKNMGSEDYRALSGAMRDTFVRVVNQDLRSVYEKILVPTLLIWGERDEATPLWMGQELEKLIPDAGLVIFEQADHYAYFHQIDRFHRIVDAFIKEDKYA